MPRNEYGLKFYFPLTEQIIYQQFKVSVSTIITELFLAQMPHVGCEEVVVWRNHHRRVLWMSHCQQPIIYGKARAPCAVRGLAWRRVTSRRFGRFTFKTSVSFWSSFVQKWTVNGRDCTPTLMTPSRPWVVKPSDEEKNPRFISSCFEMFSFDSLKVFGSSAACKCTFDTTMRYCSVLKEFRIKPNVDKNYAWLMHNF